MENELKLFLFKKLEDGVLTEDEVRDVVSTWNNKNTDKFIGLGTVHMLVMKDSGLWLEEKALFIQCANEVNGFRTFYCDSVLSKIFEYMKTHECYGIVGNIEGK